MVIYNYPSEEELVGKRFLNLTVISVDRHLCECVCDCGTNRVLRIKLLGKTKSCGCARKSSNKNRTLDLKGQVFDQLTVVGRLEDYVSKWVCLCKCGIETIVNTSALRSGNKRSCGCLWEEARKEQVKKIAISRRLAKGFPEDFQMTPFNRIEREKTKPLVKDVLKRDSFCCAWCSKQREDFLLEVHHLVPWSVSDGLRFEKTNLVTLCKDCHYAIHQGNYKGQVNPIMTILLQGFANYQESQSSREESNAYLL